MVNLTAVAVSLAQAYLDATSGYVSAAASQYMPLSSTKMTLAFVQNGDSVDHTIKFASASGDEDLTITLKATGDLTGRDHKCIGPFNYKKWNSTTTGYCALTWSSTTSMSIAIAQVPMASLQG